MLRIVGVQRSSEVDREFVLLQNQGSLRTQLRGHVLLGESAMDFQGSSPCVHVFSDAESIQPGLYVAVFTGKGTPRWTKAKDGSLVYYTYVGRSAPIWVDPGSPIHILHTHHTYCERGPALLLR